jgi:hypothetical protein
VELCHKAIAIIRADASVRGPALALRPLPASVDDCEKDEARR